MAVDKRIEKRNTTKNFLVDRYIEGTMTEDFKKYIDMLDTIINDKSVPRNIRHSSEKMKATLSNEKEPSLHRTAKVISELDIIGNDINIPLHTRTTIWGLSSQLESIFANQK